MANLVLNNCTFTRNLILQLKNVPQQPLFVIHKAERWVYSDGVGWQSECKRRSWYRRAIKMIRGTKSNTDLVLCHSKSSGSEGSVDSITLKVAVRVKASHTRVPGTAVDSL